MEKKKHPLDTWPWCFPTTPTDDQWCTVYQLLGNMHMNRIFTKTKHVLVNIIIIIIIHSSESVLKSEMCIKPILIVYLHSLIFTVSSFITGFGPVYIFTIFHVNFCYYQNTWICMNPYFYFIFISLFGLQLPLHLLKYFGDGCYVL